jgi:20S proteasome subunit beta 7
MKFMLQVSMIGVHYVDQHIATGFGIHLAQPIFRSEWKEDMTLEEGKKLLEKALLVLFYRDRTAINKIQVRSSPATCAHALSLES